VRITENQIRRIVREVLSTPKTLLKEQAARDWESYVQITTDKNYSGAQQVEDGYKKLAKKKPPTEYMKKTGWTGNESESFDDFKKWYMEWNESDFGKQLRGSNRYLSPEDVIAYFETVEQNPDPRVEAAEEVETVVAAVKTKREEIKEKKQQLEEYIKQLEAAYAEGRKNIQNSPLNNTEKNRALKDLKVELRRDKKDARKGKRRDVRDIRAKHRQQRKAQRGDKAKELGDRVQKLDIDVPSAADSGSGGSF
jgi:hypothetical protein